MLSQETRGLPLTHQKIVPGNTATSLGAEFYTYTERYLPYTGGGTTEIVVGDWIVGATSAAYAKVLKVVLSSGTWAGGDAAGYFIISCQGGAFQSENVKVAAGTNDATIAANSRLCMPHEYVNPEWRGSKATYAIVSCLSQDALIEIDGGKPDQTLLLGQTLSAGSSWALNDIEEIAQFKVIDRVASSASTIQVTYYF